MKRLIRNILLENVEKAANTIANKIVDKLKMETLTNVYNSAYDMLDEFNNIMLNYLDKNWKKYFILINPDDDDDEPEYVSKKYPKGQTYSTDEMESEMFYRFIDELKDEGFISEDETGENDIIIKNIIKFHYDNAVIQIEVNEVNGEIELRFKPQWMSGYNQSIKKILETYGIDSNEELGWKIQELVVKKIFDKLESMGVKEKYGMIKFKEKI